MLIVLPIQKRSTTKLLQRTKHTECLNIYNAKISFQLKWFQPSQNLIALKIEFEKSLQIA